MKQDVNRTNPAINKVYMVLSIIAFVFMLAAGSYFGHQGKSVEMGLAIVAGALGIALSNLDKFEIIKGAGFEAKMRQAINEAYATTESLKKLATVMGRTVSDILAVQDRFAGIGLQEKLGAKKQIDGILEELGLERHEITKIGRVFDAYIRYDHVASIIELLSKDPGIKDSLKTEAEKLAVFSKLPYTELPYAVDPAKLRAFIEEHGITSEEILEALKDYEYFETHYELRRPNQWR
jgi:hypothetical protein